MSVASARAFGALGQGVSDFGRAVLDMVTNRKAREEEKARYAEERAYRASRDAVSDDFAQKGLDQAAQRMFTEQDDRAAERIARIRENNLGRQHDLLLQNDSQAFQGSENAADRTFRGNEGAADRALRLRMMTEGFSHDRDMFNRSTAADVNQSILGNNLSRGNMLYGAGIDAMSQPIQQLGSQTQPPMFQERFNKLLQKSFPNSGFGFDNTMASPDGVIPDDDPAFRRLNSGFGGKG